jgi:hypothetical protein
MLSLPLIQMYKFKAQKKPQHFCQGFYLLPYPVGIDLSNFIADFQRLNAFMASTTISPTCLTQ